MWVVPPANAAMAAFGTTLPLYILQVGGSVLDVGNLTAIFSMVGIPSALFWGVLTDNLRGKKVLFLVAYSGMSISYTLIFGVPDLGWLGLFLGLLGFSMFANSSAFNFILMETWERRSWISGVAGMSLMANLGAIFGLSICLIILDFAPLAYILIFCTISALIALSLSYLLIHEPGLRSLSPIIQTPVRVAQAFGSVPTPASPVPLLQRLQQAIGTSRTSIVVGFSGVTPVFFFSSFFFTFSMAYLTTSYVPFLAAREVPTTLIFATSLLNLVAQTAVYKSVDVVVRRYRGGRVGEGSILFVSLCFLLIAASGSLPSGLGFAAFNLIVFGALGVGLALWNSSTSVSLFSQIGRTARGRVMGSYIALTGFGSVVGSLVSGTTSFYFGYTATFLASATTMLLTLVLRFRYRSIRGESLE